MVLAGPGSGIGVRARVDLAASPSRQVPFKRHTTRRRCPLCGIDHLKKVKEAESKSSFQDGCRLRLGELTGAKSRLFKQEARIYLPAEAADPPRVGPEYCRLNAGCLPVGGPNRPELPLLCRGRFAACRGWSEGRLDCF